jgi:hypothetical protein
MVSLTSKSDGYATVGLLNKNGLGLYYGMQYNNTAVTNQANTLASGSIPANTSYGVLKMLANDKILIGGGVKEKNNQKYSNFLIGYAPLKNEGSTKLWLTGEITGGQLFGGLGLSYKFSK